MSQSSNIDHWNDVAKDDVDFSSVVDPGDKSGLKIDYINRIDKKYIETEISKLPESSKILDFGCGSGRLIQWNIFNKHVYSGVDISQNMIDAAKRKFGNNKNMSFTSYNGQELPFENNSFDCIVAVSVLQYVIDDQNLKGLFNEFARILKIKGKVLLIEQIADEEKYDYFKNGVIHKKFRPVKKYFDFFSENFNFISSKQTDGLISYGLFYKSLNIFSRLNFTFLKNIMSWFINFDDAYYYLTKKLNILKPIWLNTFIVIEKK